MVILTEALHGTGPLAYYRALLALHDAGEGHTEAIVVDLRDGASATAMSRLRLARHASPV